MDKGWSRGGRTRYKADEPRYQRDLLLSSVLAKSEFSASVPSRRNSEKTGTPAPLPGHADSIFNTLYSSHESSTRKGIFMPNEIDDNVLFDLDQTPIDFRRESVPAASEKLFWIWSVQSVRTIENCRSLP